MVRFLFKKYFLCGVLLVVNAIAVLAQPFITFTPSNGTTNFPVASNLTIDFSQAIRNIDDSEITNANVGDLLTLKLTNAAGADVGFTATINGGADLATDQVYYLAIDPVENASNEATVASNITFSTTDTQTPIITFSPANGATNVPTNNNIIISFNEPVRRIDDSPITDGNVGALITLKETNAAGADIVFTATINAGKTEITINPTGALPDLSDIYVALAPVEDNANNATVLTASTFTTADDTPPIITFSPTNGALNVSTATNIVISFSESIRNIDNSEITNANVASLLTFKLTNAGGADVAFIATINAGKTEITLVPSAALNQNQDYFVRINPVEDASNNATVTTSITFSSEDTLAPVATFNPANGATNVNNSANIIITFNEPIRDLDNSELTNTTIDGKVILKLTDAAGANIPFNATINAGKTVVTIDPTGALPDLSTIYVAINNVEDNFNNAITLQSITFTTTDGTPPVITFIPTNGTADVALSANLIINFDEPIRNINDSEITNGNVASLLTLKLTNAGGADVPFSATINVAQTQITIDPTSNFLVNQVYYLAIAPIEDNFNNATPLTSITFQTVNLAVNAGTNRTICAGEITTLGGAPSISGGNGFFNIQWSSVPVGFTSNVPNPSVAPTVTTTYTLLVEDSDGNTDSRDVTVTVNTPTPPASLAIQFNPIKANDTYSTDDDPVQLTFTLNGSPGVFSGNTRFEGPGVNSQGFFKYFYPQAGNIGENIIKLLYENAEGCITERTRTIRIVTPNDLISGIDALYCDIDQNDALLINQPESIPNAANPFGYRYVYKNSIVLRYQDNTVVAPAPGSGYNVSGTNITINPGRLSTQKGTGRYFFSPIYDIELLQYNIITGVTVYYIYENYDFFSIPFLVAPKPEIELQVDDLYCENDGFVRLAAVPRGGEFRINNTSTGLSVDPAGDTFLDPSNVLLPDNIVISYEFTNVQGCFNREELPATIFRLPYLDFTFSNGCQGDSIIFTPQLGSPNNIQTYEWSYGLNNISSDELPGNAIEPSGFLYNVPGNYQIRIDYSTNTTKPCKSDVVKTLVIGEIPSVNFNWSNVCLSDATTFNGLVTGLGSSSISEANWDFNGSGYVVAPINTSFTYPTVGSRTASLRIVTSKNCTNEISKTVFTVPKVASSELPYIEDFNTTNGGWVSGINLNSTVGSSWLWDQPTGYDLAGDADGTGNAWFTNNTTAPNLHYSLNEKSWVHSPCFDLRTIERPVLSVDIRVLLQKGLDGVVIQMDSTSLTNTENTWVTIGALNSTQNWYNALGLPGNPGVQALNQFGWTDDADTVSWRTALLPLDTYLPRIPANREKVRFRIALGSQSSNLSRELDGFAFDNFTIKERNRTVLLEYFTNKATTPFNGTVNSFALEPITFNTRSEILKLEYHLGAPAQDVIYAANPADPSARATFYGITTAPAVRLDAQFQSSPFSQWAIPVFSQRTLQSAPVTIDNINIEQVDDDIIVKAAFTVIEELPVNTIAHMVLIEKQVPDNGDMFRYVVRKMLPNATGKKFTGILPVSATPIELEERWTPSEQLISDPTQLAIVVFLQNEDTKEVYQAQYQDNLNFVPTLITGLEPTLSSQIKVYPNPANEFVTISLPETYQQPVSLKLYDTFGRMVSQTEIAEGTTLKTLPTTDLSGGLYLLHLNFQTGTVVQKKVLVVRQ